MFPCFKSVTGRDRASEASPIYYPTCGQPSVETNSLPGTASSVLIAHADQGLPASRDGTPYSRPLPPFLPSDVPKQPGGRRRESETRCGLFFGRHPPCGKKEVAYSHLGWRGATGVRRRASGWPPRIRGAETWFQGRVQPGFPSSFAHTCTTPHGQQDTGVPQ